MLLLEVVLLVGGSRHVVLENLIVFLHVPIRSIGSGIHEVITKKINTRKNLQLNEFLVLI
jgi:hypothetical protein